MLSHTARTIKIRIEDDDGRLVSEGPDGNLLLSISTEQVSNTAMLADEQGTINLMTSIGRQDIFRKVAGEHLYNPDDFPSLGTGAINVSQLALWQCFS